MILDLNVFGFRIKDKIKSKFSTPYLSHESFKFVCGGVAACLISLQMLDSLHVMETATSNRILSLLMYTI